MPKHPHNSNHGGSSHDKPRSSIPMTGMRKVTKTIGGNGPSTKSHSSSVSLDHFKTNPTGKTGNVESNPDLQGTSG